MEYNPVEQTKESTTRNPLSAQPSTGNVVVAPLSNYIDLATRLSNKMSDKTEHMALDNNPTSSQTPSPQATSANLPLSIEDILRNIIAKSDFSEATMKAMNNHVEAWVEALQHSYVNEWKDMTDVKAELTKAGLPDNLISKCLLYGMFLYSSLICSLACFFCFSPTITDIFLGSTRKDKPESTYTDLDHLKTTILFHCRAWAFDKPRTRIRQ